MTGAPIVVDGSAGGALAFTEAVARGLRERGLEVEGRPPRGGARGRGPGGGAAPPRGGSMFDPAVHLVSSGIVIRVHERPDRETLAAIEEVGRGALLAPASVRRRTRTVPVHLGETMRVLEWIDVFG